jgi:hypothetical protein
MLKEPELDDDEFTFEVTPWRQVGTVVGNAGTGEFTFILKQFQARVGDIVALSMDIPGGDWETQSRIYVWARITDINRFNPFSRLKRLRKLPAKGFRWKIRFFPAPATSLKPRR